MLGALCRSRRRAGTCSIPLMRNTAPAALPTRCNFTKAGSWVQSGPNCTLRVLRILQFHLVVINLWPSSFQSARYVILRDSSIDHANDLLGPTSCRQDLQRPPIRHPRFTKDFLQRRQGSVEMEPIGYDLDRPGTN